MVEKKRQKLTAKNIFEKIPYKSILNLLIEFQDKDFQGEKGLKPLHFRYALEQNYQKPKLTFCLICKKKYPNIKSKNCPKCHTKLEIDPRVKSNINRLKPFFGEELDYLINTNRIVPGCITSRQNLTKFLNNLKNPPIMAIEKIGSNADARYHIKKEFRFELMRIDNKTAFDSYSLDEILYFFYDYPHRHQAIYGISQRLLKCFTKEEKDIIEKIMGNVDKQLKKIQDVRDGVSERECVKRLNHFLDNTKSEKIKKLIRERGILIRSRDPSPDEPSVFDKKGTLWAEWKEHNHSGIRFLVFLKNIVDKENRPAAGKRTVTECRFWSELHFNKNYGFSSDDIQEIERWWKDNDDIMDIHQKSRQLSFSRYF